ncbi:MAG: ankyrin repeat domain-containing protein [Wolbachia endosymbiont of Xenopsylla cheopis]
MIGSKKMLAALERQVFEAIRNNNIEGMIEILGLGFDINVQDYFGRTPIFLAALYNNLLMIEKLAELGADLEIKSNLGDTVLSKMVSKDNPYKKIPKEEQLAIIKVLINWGAKPTTNIHGVLPIHIAIQVRCSLDIVKELLTEDTVNKKDIFGYAPLHLAVLSNQINIIELLIKHKGVNIDTQRSTTRDTPLILAARYELIEITQLLLIHNANPNLKNLYGQTFFGFAVSKEIRSLPSVIKVFKQAKSENRENLHPSLSSDHACSKYKMLENKLSATSYLCNLASRHNKFLGSKPSLSTIFQSNIIYANSPQSSIPSVSSSESGMLTPESGILSVSSLESNTSNVNSPESSVSSVSSFESSISEISQFEILGIDSPKSDISEVSQLRRLSPRSNATTLFSSDVSEESEHSTSAILGSPKSSLSESFTNQFQGALDIDSSSRSTISEISQSESISSPGSGISTASRLRNISPPTSSTSESTRSSIDSFSPSGSHAVDSKKRKLNHIFSYNNTR